MTTKQIKSVDVGDIDRALDILYDAVASRRVTASYIHYLVLQHGVPCSLPAVCNWVRRLCRPRRVYWDVLCHIALNHVSNLSDSSTNPEKTDDFVGES